jgi:hypothetical protein
MRGKWRVELLRTDGGEFARPARGFPECNGVVRHEFAVDELASAGGRLIDTNLATRGGKLPRDRGRNISLSDSSIGTSNEKSGTFATCHGGETPSV